MKCLILAAGYATRLYPLTKNFPKPLLKIKNKTIIDWLIEDLNSFNAISEYYVVSNHKFIDEFNKWNHYDNLKIIDDGTTQNESRLGAVRDIELVLDSTNIDDDLLIMAGDNLLDFSLSKFIDFFKSKDANCVMAYFEEDINRLRKVGVAKVDDNGLIIHMEEKPHEPKGNWIIPPFYIIKKDSLKYIKKGISEGINVDAPGSIVSYLANKTNVYAYLMNGKRYDIGNIESYNEVNKTYNIDN